MQSELHSFLAFKKAFWPAARRLACIVCIPLSFCNILSESPCLLRCQIWRDNIPLFKILSNPGSQGWVREEWGKWVFPLKVEKYIRRLQAFIPLRNGAHIRTALDIGCGVSAPFFR